MESIGYRPPSSRRRRYQVVAHILHLLYRLSVAHMCLQRGNHDTSLPQEDPVMFTRFLQFRW